MWTKERRSLIYHQSQRKFGMKWFGDPAVLLGYTIEGANGADIPNWEPGMPYELRIHKKDAIRELLIEEEL